jgi:UPF0716 protein FxsA
VLASSIFRADIVCFVVKLGNFKGCIQHRTDDVLFTKRFFMCKLFIMNPFLVFLLLLIIVPVVEIYLLIQVGSSIGAFSTVLLIVATAVLGAYLFRLQGMSTVQRVQASLSRGEIPALEMIEGAMLLLSAALLLTPGFVTDIVGFVCLIPTVRRKFASSVLASQFVNQAPFQGASSFNHSGNAGGSDSDIIEGEFKREEDEPPKINKED